MGLHRITGFLDERGEFERTGQRVGVWLMEASLQSAAIQADDGSTKVLLYQPRIKFPCLSCFSMLKIMFNDQCSMFNSKNLCDLCEIK